MHTHGHFLHVLYFLGTHLKWLPILHTLMRVLSCIVCCHAMLPHHLLSPINALWTQQWHIVALPSSTSTASGAAAAGLAAHAFCAAGCAGALLKMPNMLCWLCLALLIACLPFPSALLSMLIPVKSTAELPFTTHHWSSQYH